MTRNNMQESAPNNQDLSNAETHNPESVQSSHEVTGNDDELRLRGYEKTLALLRPLNEEAAKNFEITTESRCFRLGSAALKLFNANQAEKISDFVTVRLDDIRGMFSENSKRGFRLFFQDRYKQNVQRLQENFDEDTSAALVEAYSDMMKDFPELRNVRIDATYLKDRRGGVAYYGKDISGKILPTVQLESSFIHNATEITTRVPETDYYGHKELYCRAGYVFDEVQNIAVPKRNARTVATLESVAKKLEIEPAKLAQDKKLFGVLVMAHEFGHHLHFRRNYFGVAMDQLRKEEKFGQILQKAQSMYVHDNLFDPEAEQFRKNNTERAKERATLKLSDKDIIQQMQRAGWEYRNQMVEIIADTFAIDFLKKYAKKYGFDGIIN